MARGNKELGFYNFQGSYKNYRAKTLHSGPISTYISHIEEETPVAFAHNYETPLKCVCKYQAISLGYEAFPACFLLFDTWLVFLDP